MPIYFVHAGARLDIDDIPLDDYAAIHDATGLQWPTVAANPWSHAKAAAMLAQAAARVAGVSLPEPLTPKALMALYKVENDGESNLPSEFTDGIPDPKAEDAPATT